MSHTDAHRPWRVTRFFDGTTRHDHRSGACRPVEDWQSYNAGWRTPTHHYRTCPRVEWVAAPCPGPADCYSARAVHQQALQDAHALSDRRQLLRLHNRPEMTFCDRPHGTYRRNEEMPCQICDSRKGAPTCEPEVPYQGRAARKDKRRLAERGARRRTRDTVRGLLREVNTYGYSDREIEPTRHRHDATWWAG